MKRERERKREPRTCAHALQHKGHTFELLLLGGLLLDAVLEKAHASGEFVAFLLGLLFVLVLPGHLRARSLELSLKLLLGHLSLCHLSAQTGLQVLQVALTLLLPAVRLFVVVRLRASSPCVNSNTHNNGGAR
jgi:hypothetical protein